MHRSSESVAAIATALAKAQTELSNPEKAMVGTIYNSRSESPQSFRYASLSSGLDIVRKALGGHQIAIAQITDIDSANGTVNLTTLLMHTSGEWITPVLGNRVIDRQDPLVEACRQIVGEPGG